MKKFALLSAAALVLALGACTTTQKKECCGTCEGKCSEKASMGTVGEKKECGKTCGDKASMGTVSGEKTCGAAKGAMGAVSGSSCSKSCGSK